MYKQISLQRRPRDITLIETNPQNHPFLPQDFVTHNLCTRIGRSFPQQKGGYLGQFRRSLWQIDQNILYMQFLAKNKQLFGGSRSRHRATRANLRMSVYLETRSPEQCRSHHQKMVKYHGNIPNIIAHIRLLAQKQNLNPKTLSSLQSSPRPSEDVLEKQKVGIGALVSSDVVFDWDSWLEENEKAWEERVVLEWLDGVEEIYGVV